MAPGRFAGFDAVPGHSVRPRSLRLWCSPLAVLFLAVLPFLLQARHPVDPATTYQGLDAEQWARRLHHPLSTIREQAFEKLARPEDGAEVVLVPLADHEDRLVRMAACIGLAFRAPHVPESIPVLVRRVTDTDLNTRYWAISALKGYGPAAGVGVPALMEALGAHPDRGVRLTGPRHFWADARVVAAEALGAVGRGARAALPALEFALGDESQQVREAARKAIKRIRGRSRAR